MSSLFPRSARVLAAIALSACHGTTVAPKPPPAPLDESEPNDTAFEAPWYGSVFPGSSLAIAGHVTSNGPDLYDGFAFTTGAPCTLRFVLRPALAGTDLDLCVYDPSLDEFVACFDSPSGTEVGEIALPGAGIDFHLVVSSAWAASSYLLEIEAFPYMPSPLESDATPPAGGPAEGKGTLERVDGYRARDVEAQVPARAPLAIGWIGEVDLDTGRIARLPFAAHEDGLAFGTPR
jgi:hypothetical protein